MLFRRVPEKSCPRTRRSHVRPPGATCPPIRIFACPSARGEQTGHPVIQHISAVVAIVAAVIALTQVRVMKVVANADLFRKVLKECSPEAQRRAREALHPERQGSRRMDPRRVLQCGQRMRLLRNHRLPHKVQVPTEATVLGERRRRAASVLRHCSGPDRTATRGGGLAGALQQLRMDRPPGVQTPNQATVDRDPALAAVGPGHRRSVRDVIGTAGAPPRPSGEQARPSALGLRGR
jgi:hypothetical protein